MGRWRESMRAFSGVAGLTATMLVVGAIAFAAGTAKGTATYASKKGPITVTFTHAALVSGPTMGSTTPVKRLILSTRDVSGVLATCDSMMTCGDGGITEGMTVDLEDGPRLPFWFVANGQLVQYSGMIKPEVAVLTTNTADRVAGTLTFDQSAGGGPSVTVTFDAPLTKTLKK
jgi:hypothetical protein